jgi:hypothetical protein
MSSLPDRAHEILGNIELAHQDLLDLAAEILRANDYTKPADLKASYEFMEAYYDEVQTLDEIVQTLSALIEDHTGADLDEGPEIAETAAGEDGDPDRIIEALDREEPHSLDEDFTYRRPFGFVLLGRGYQNVRTWKRLYEQVCQQMAERDPDRFDELPEMERFHTQYGNQYFARDPEVLRSPRMITDSVYAETHFSANGLSSRIEELLDAYGVPADDMTIYLREDRDA